jgi:hypothetical protein
MVAYCGSVSAVVLLEAVLESGQRFPVVAVILGCSGVPNLSVTVLACALVSFVVLGPFFGFSGLSSASSLTSVVGVEDAVVGDVVRGSVSATGVWSLRSALVVAFEGDFAAVPRVFGHRF